MSPKPPGPVLPDSTHSSLLEQARARDPEAWRRLVDLFGPLVYHWCRRARLGPEDRADVFQDVFRSVALHLADFRKDRPDDSFRGWLLTITQNKIRDHFRRQAARPQAAGGSDALNQLGQIPAPSEGPDPSDEADSRAELLHRALELIRGDFEPATWQAFWRTVVDGQLPADIAADLGITINAVYKAKSRVLYRLRAEFAGLIE